ncbi:MAG TPA: hypothetical protein VF707_04525 [Ardenticatenaceae bacterium]|jgi:urease gamma subunit
MAEEEQAELRLRPRPSEAISIEVPSDTLAALQRVAAIRDMSQEALLKLYIGHGLRQDVARLFADRVLETTAKVLARHIQSEEEVSEIIREIQVEATG